MNPELCAFHYLEDHFFTSVSVNKVDYGHLIAFNTGVQAAGLNPAFVKRIDEDIHYALAACSDDYKNNQVPWSLVIPDYLFNQYLEHELQAHHFIEQGTGVAMMLELSDYRGSLSQENLRCQLMGDDLDAWSIPLIEGFKSTANITSVYTQRHKHALSCTPSMYHFSGYYEDQIVSSLTLSTNHYHARIDDVATSPAYQKLGFATTLIHEAILFARQRQIKDCFLEASDDGLGVYQRLGFKKLFTQRYYELLHDSS